MNLKNKAIEAALNNRWQEAVELNRKMIKETPHDGACLNRLAHAYLRLGNAKKAIQTYKKTLKVNAYDPIALKNLKILKEAPGRLPSKEEPISPNVFLKEPKKTKTIPLANVAPAKILARLMSGQEAFLLPKKYNIEVRTRDNAYLGVVPDDISFKLIKFIRLGNRYQAFVKTIEKNNLTILIKEIKRGKSLKNQPTF